MNQQHLENMFHASVNVNLMKQNISQTTCGITTNVGWYECRKHHICEKEYAWNPATCDSENRKY